MARPHSVTHTMRIGSLVGGVWTFAAYWLISRVQIRAQGLMKRHAERETL